MHSAERVLLPLLNRIGGKSGQNNIYGLLQNIFKFGYYCKKYWSTILAILALVFSDKECREIQDNFLKNGNVNYEDMAEIYLSKFNNVDDSPNTESKDEEDFFDDDFSFLSLMDIPKEIRKKFGNVCLSRWISLVRQARMLIHRLNIEAPEKMIQMVIKDIEQPKEELDKFFHIATCFGDKSKLSLWCLMFYYISHHAAGGKNGDLFLNGLEVCAFLCSPSFRVGLQICSTIYPVEMEWAEFFNSKTKINDKTACISTRVLESTSFYRKILNWTYLLKTDWKSIFHDTMDLLKSDNLIFTEEDQLPKLFEAIEKMIDETAPDVFKKCQEVYMFPLFNIGFSINLVFDPIVSRAYVATLLNALSSLHLLPTEQQKTNSDDFDCYIDGIEFAYPELLMQDFVSLIKNDLTSNRERTEAHVYALGLHNMSMIEELLQIASGKFLELILELEPPWKAGDDFSIIFGLCQVTFGSIYC